MYEWDFGLLWGYRWLFLDGLWVTVSFTVAIVAGGLAVGLVGALGLLCRFAPLRLASLAFIEVFRCTPILVQLIWCYYALPILAGIELSATSAALIALSCYGGAFYAEIIRGGIVSIDPGQSEAGAALGMIPALMNQSILQFKNTSLVSVLAVPDLVYQGQMAAHDSFRPLETYTAIAVAYFVILFPLTLFVRHRERRLGSRS
jgi:polar amino acid transport system permease protein